MLPFFLFIGLPILEIVLLVMAGDALGLWWVVGWIFLSAMIGIILVRQQGLAAIARAQEAQDAGELPVGAILTGIRLAFAGVCMIVPGFITDAIGLLLLLPWTGDALGRVMAAKVRMHSTWTGGGRTYSGSYRYPPDDDTIDADYEVVNPGSPPATTSPGSPPEPPERPGRNPWQKGRIEGPDRG